MKKNPVSLRWLGSLSIGLSLIASLVAGHADVAPNPTESYTNNFNTDQDVRSWIYWYGINAGNSPVPFDAAVDAATNSGSGSLAVTLPFGASGNQQVFFGTFGNQYGYDGTIRYNGNQFTNIQVDVLVAADAPVSSQGDFGALEYSLVRSGVPAGGGPFTSNVRIPGAASNHWVHLTLPVIVGTEGYDDPGVIGACFKYTSYSGYPTSSISFWLDNLTINVSPIEIPPPTLSTEISSASPGLSLLGVSGGSEFQRTSVKYVNQTGIGFLEQPGATYSFTIKEFPDTILFPNYQAHIFLTTGPGTASSLDYNETNLIWLNVQGNTNGGATAYFRYKINEPGANTNLFGDEYTVGPLGTPWAGQLTNISATTEIGTWSMTFNQNTNVTLRSPDGNSVAFAIRPEVAAAFVEPLNLVFGAQPNRPTEDNPLGNLGQKVVLANAAMTNDSAVVFSDDFLSDTVLNTNIFSILANAPNSVFLFPNDPGQKLVKWNVPDTGFYLEVSSNLSGAWLPVSSSVSFAANGFRNLLVPSAALSAQQNYFRLVKREFSKLQILLPGETAAPGTPTGKTGTPLAQHVGVAFPIIVNAVDSNWVKITSASDQISLSSTDAAFNWPGFPGTMTAGTITFDVDTWGLALGTEGTQTITASDVTDPSKTADTSSSVTVQP